jgi:hypothetical protein
MAWAGVEARRWRWDYLALFSVRPIEAYRKLSESKKDVDNDKAYKALFLPGNVNEIFKPGL